MNWLAFVASIVGSLAWPLTIIIVVLIFRRQLLAAVPWLRELEIGKLKLIFAERLAKASSEAEQIEALPVAPEQQALPPAPDIQTILATHAPRALVLESWIKVESALARATKYYGSGTSRGNLTVKTIRDLESRGLVPREIARIVEDLRSLRNSAVHLPDFAIDAQQALEYAQLADRVVAALNSIPEQAS